MVENFNKDILMSQWIKDPEVKPHIKQKILATLVEHGEPKVVSCWYVEGNRIMMDDSPNAQTYSFSLVKAWQPFPEPYDNYGVAAASKTAENR